jgi:hypothetical protein
MTRRTLIAVLSATAVLGVGCGGDEAEEAPAGAAPEGSFVGPVSGTDAYIAVVSDGERVTGYLCDGKELSTWFDSEVEGTGADLLSRDGDDLGDATFSGGGVTGEVEVDGQSQSFNATPATGDAGLYRAANVEEADGELSEGEAEVGWIVLADGSQRGSTNFIDPSGDLIVSRPAPKLATGSTQVNITNFGALAVNRVLGFIDPTSDI